MPRNDSYTTRLARRLVAAIGVWGAALAAPTAEAASLGSYSDAQLPALGPLATPGRGYPPAVHLRAHQPHPAVARIIVPEGEATSYGSGTLVDVRDQFGLVVTNWHVVRDGKGDVEVVFPDGFRSKARPLKVDPDWDLAALVIWRPPAPPVTLAATAPRSGDQLTICGYGQGQYRAVTGHCTQYYSPKVDLPQHMVELDVEARQGDSGGPIFNDRGELAGVLFGAGSGTTLGSFGGQVESFLATLAPDIGRAADDALTERQPAAICVGGVCAPQRPAGSASKCGPDACRNATVAAAPGAKPQLDGGDAGSSKPSASRPMDAAKNGPSLDGAQWSSAAMTRGAPQLAASGVDSPPTGDWTEDAKTLLAAIGAITLVVQVVRAVG